MHSGYKLSSVLSTQDAQNLAQTARSWWETKKKKKKAEHGPDPQDPPNLAPLPSLTQTGHLS